MKKKNAVSQKLIFPDFLMSLSIIPNVSRFSITFLKSPLFSMFSLTAMNPGEFEKIAPENDSLC